MKKCRKYLSLLLALVMTMSLCVPALAVEDDGKNAKNILEKEGFFRLSDAECKEETSHSISGDIVITRDYVDKKSELFLIKSETVAMYMYADLENRVLTCINYTDENVQVKTQEIEGTSSENTRLTRGLRDYVSLGRVRYRYANGSQYSLCGANVALASTVSNSG